VPLPDYSNLVGTDLLLTKIDELVNSLKPGQILSVEGMGGIGKTALIHAYVNQPSVNQNYFEVLWVSARQPQDGTGLADQKVNSLDFTLEDVTSRLAEQLGLSHLVDKALDERLKGIQAAAALQKYFLVIDNLETVSDYLELIPSIARYCGHCKVVITTRESLREFPFVSVFQVPELTRDFASQLVKAEVSRRGKNPWISDYDMVNLYQTVGGLPLALKLVAAQLHLSTVAEIVNEFKQAKLGKEAIYRFLYWKIWNALDDDARRLLFTFLISDPEGEDSQFLGILAGLPPESFARSFQTLDTFSLIETNWSRSAPKYRIHRLTATFLQTDVLKHWEWESNAN
jgi:LuxR family glucitol operon transcriptional activator